MKPTGSLVYDSAGKAELLCHYFDGKQSKSGVELPPLCHPQPLLTSLTFRAKSVQRLLQELDGHRGADLHQRCAPSERNADVQALALNRVYRALVRRSSLSKVFGRLLVGQLSVLLEMSDSLPARKYAYRKGLGCCDSLLDICHQAQIAFEKD